MDLFPAGKCAGPIVRSLLMVILVASDNRTAKSERLASENILSLKWIFLGPVLALLLLAHSFANNLGYGVGSWEVPPGQPDQIWSQVDYDANLSDPFFESNEWSYPYGGQVVTSGMWPEGEDPPRLKHTAKCFSTSFGGREHRVRFCEVKLLDVNMIDLFIHDTTKPAYFDKLRVHIRNGMFMCQYSTVYKDSTNVGLIWTTKRQELTLDKKSYHKGDTIKGRIDFECVQEISNPKYVGKWGRNPKSIKVYGVFNAIVQ
ncbi:MAG: hypothetical protein AB1473_23515 [Thermodesulfobacteriota bacterium]